MAVPSFKKHFWLFLPRLSSLIIIGDIFEEATLNFVNWRTEAVDFLVVDDVAFRSHWLQSMMIFLMLSIYIEAHFLEGEITGFFPMTRIIEDVSVLNQTSLINFLLPVVFGAAAWFIHLNYFFYSILELFLGICQSLGLLIFLLLLWHGGTFCI